MNAWDLLDDPSPLTPHSPDERASVTRRGVVRRRRRRALAAAPVVVLLVAALPLVQLGSDGHRKVIITPTSPSPVTHQGIDGEQYGNGSLPDGPPTGRFTQLDDLVTVTVGNVSMKVPSGWVRHDVTLPSDHTDIVFTDPANVTARVEISQSGCAVCVTGVNGTVPNPTLVLPKATTSTFRISTTERGFAERPWQGYAVNGVAIATQDAKNGIYAVMVRVALPAADNATVTRILNSVTTS